MSVYDYEADDTQWCELCNTNEDLSIAIAADGSERVLCSRCWRGIGVPQ